MDIYITFGQAHIHRVNGKVFDKDCVAVIHAKNEKEGREKAFKYFGEYFCTSYTKMNNDILKYFPRGLICVE